MNKFLDDVRRDAIKKFKPTGEEDKKQIIDAAVLALEFKVIALTEGFLAMEEYTEKKMVDGFLKKIIILIVDGTDIGIILEIVTNEYWAKNPQGVQAMVYYMYLLAADDILYSWNPDSLTTMIKSLRALLPIEYHDEFDKQANNIVEKKKQLEQKKQQSDYLFKKKWELQRQEAEKFLHFHPVITNPELFENVHTLEEEIGKLPDISLRKVLKEMVFEILCDCFYVLSDKARQKILNNYDSFESLIKDYAYMDYVIEIKEHEEDELLGAVFVMLGTMKKLHRQDKL